jgi:hypothetical protein
LFGHVLLEDHELIAEQGQKPLPLEVLNTPIIHGNLEISEKEIQVISNFYSSYHYTKVLFDALQVSVDGQVEPN